MIDQIAFAIVLIFCLAIAFCIGAVICIVGINVLCLSALMYYRARRRGSILIPTNLMRAVGNVAFAPAYWALRKMDEDGR